MSLISIIGIMGMVIGLFQIISPDFFLKINLQGVKTREVVKYGGFGAIFVGFFFIIFDLII